MTETELPAAGDFLRLFELEPDLPSTERAPGDPPVPENYFLYTDTVENYRNLAGQNSNNGYGATGLMCVVDFPSSNCYGDCEAGTLLLFPGIYSQTPPPFSGTASLNCATHAPLYPGSHGTPLHMQMCQLLLQNTSNFIGFGVKYPYDAKDNVGYNSTTCNPYWFNGSRTLPTDWQQIVYHVLSAVPGAADRRPVAAGPSGMSGSYERRRISIS